MQKKPKKQKKQKKTNNLHNYAELMQKQTYAELCGPVQHLYKA